MQTAIIIGGVWLVSAVVVAIALWKDREHTPDRPFRGMPPADANPERLAEIQPARRRRAPSGIPTYPSARQG